MIKDLFYFIKNNYKKHILKINKDKNLIGFEEKDLNILLVCYSNEVYKKFIYGALNNFIESKNIKQFLITSNTYNIYKEINFYENFAKVLKESMHSKEDNIVVLEDFDAFLADDKVRGVVESLYNFTKDKNEKTKFFVVFTDKKETMKLFCKNDPSLLRIGFLGCLAEIACLPYLSKSPEEAIEELIYTEELLGEINEN